MGIFGQQARKEDGATPAPAAPKLEPEPVRAAPPPSLPSTQKMEDKFMAVNKPGISESVLSSGLTIEGKIEGDGSVRLAGRFKGQVNVKGEVTIEPGASIEGEMHADTVLVGGEVLGKIHATSRVELKDSGSLIGDLKAGTLAVAAGSKMRGKVEFGWKDGEIENVKQSELRLGKVQ
jgi:cytoskeletal protein CcmA (bactofilin family)